MTADARPYGRRVRALRGALVVVALAAGAAADDRPRTSIDAIVPVPPTEHERLHWFGRRHHHVVPGTVTIDRAPYVCDLDGKTFRTDDDFVAHLRTAHHARPAAIPEHVLVRDGQVHFIGE